MLVINPIVALLALCGVGFFLRLLNFTAPADAFVQRQCTVPFRNGTIIINEVRA